MSLAYVGVVVKVDGPLFATGIGEDILLFLGSNNRVIVIGCDIGYVQVRNVRHKIRREKVFSGFSTHHNRLHGRRVTVKGNY